MHRIILLSLLLISPAFADEAEEADTEPMLRKEGTVECISLARLDRTRVVDDSTILFYMLGPDVYVNRLRRKCNGLARTDALSYQTSLNRLCNVDIITGLRQSGGSFFPAARCGLGLFVPISEIELEQLLAEPELEPDPDAANPEIEAPTETVETAPADD